MRTAGMGFGLSFLSFLPTSSITCIPNIFQSEGDSELDATGTAPT